MAAKKKPTTSPAKRATTKPAEPAPRSSRKAKIGRPPRAGKAATSAILVRLTASEKAKLEAAAKRAGKSLSAHLRDAALSIS